VAIRGSAMRSGPRRSASRAKSSPVHGDGSKTDPERSTSFSCRIRGHHFRIKTNGDGISIDEFTRDFVRIAKALHNDVTEALCLTGNRNDELLRHLIVAWRFQSVPCRRVDCRVARSVILHLLKER
jgi:hypothetical protein